MKVNKILKITAVALCGVFALSGCIRETAPQNGAITESQLTSSSLGLDNSLKGIAGGIMSPAYGMWSHGDFGYTSFGVWNDHANQLIIPCTILNGGNQYYDRFQQPQYGVGMGANGYMSHHYWYQAYPNIKNCNDMLNTVAGMENNEKYVGIAKAFRALLYLDLARLFEALPANAPDNGNYAAELMAVNELTVPIVDENVQKDESLAKNNPRATREELFTFILADIADAEECLKDYRRDYPSFPTLPAVYALYARAYHWLGGFEDNLYAEVPTGKAAYTLAAEYARKSIDAAGGAIMTQAEWTDPRTAFNTEASSWIWSLQMSSDTVLGNLHAFCAHMCPEATYGYAPLAMPGVGYHMYDRLSKTDFRKSLMLSEEPSYNDIKGRTLYTEEEFDAQGFAPFTFFKFRPGSGEMVDYMTANAITFPIIRLEEMYFIEMESILHTQGVDAGWAKLVEFMAHRDPKYVCPYATEEGVLDEMIFQKQIEFWGEGHTLFDMKRLNMGIDTDYPGLYPAGATFKTEGRVPWWNIPIPMDEMQVNLGIQANNPDPSGAVASTTDMPE